MVSPGGAEPPSAPSGTGAAGSDAGSRVGGTRMLTALVRLHGVVGDLALPLEVDDAPAARDDRVELVSQLEDYLIPRVTTMEGPLLAVVGGSTGAGKSTLVSSLVGAPVTQSGVLRPTTRSPVLVHHPDDSGWFDQDRLLPELTRVDRPTNDPEAIQLVVSDAVPAGIAVLDAPDVDSVEAANRNLAAELLAAGDLWVFVTSAARYSDQVPWELLRRAAERATSVAIVLDRTSAEDAGTVATHLARMLASRGLKDCPLFTVPESQLDEQGLLPERAVRGIRDWMQALADDTDARAAVAARTVGGAIRTLGARSHALAGAYERQLAAATELREEAQAAYAAGVVAAREATADGTMLRGEVLAQWQELVGTGDLIRSFEDRVGRLRERVVNAVRGRPQSAERVTTAIEVGLVAVLVEHAERAAQQAVAAWRGHGAGTRLVESTPADLGRATPDVRSRAGRLAAEWRDGLGRMIKAEVSDTRATARYLELGADGLTAALMIVVLSQSQGTLSVAPGEAGSSARLGERLLAAVFGEQAVRSLASRARSDLDRRVASLLAAEGARHLEVLDALRLDPGLPERVREAARRVDDVRFRSSRPAVDDAGTP
ncbi:dynamin family protein [Nocardioides sp. CFH 31398]|uniref:dynamin family protein n=1 Tax=Nocardioides sp. CFH 31398 TaxID=2919579 RepID=UPI001F069161|nr:dynamin family protein [Nocardioides sp. CFH 31398]MCH1867202.1 dynamin family protein [Nocardioides sp. CFH 31398]